VIPLKPIEEDNKEWSANKLKDWKKVISIQNYKVCMILKVKIKIFNYLMKPELLKIYYKRLNSKLKIIMKVIQRQI